MDIATVDVTEHRGPLQKAAACLDHATCARARRAMSTRNATEDKSLGTTAGPDRGGIDTDHLDLPYDATLLGVDGEGDVHLHSPKADRVYVLDDSHEPAKVTHETPLGGRSVWDWVEHTEQARGEWAELRYVRGGAFENIVRDIIRAQAQIQGQHEEGR